MTEEQRELIKAALNRCVEAGQGLVKLTNQLGEDAEDIIEEFEKTEPEFYREFEMQMQKIDTELS